MQLDQHADRRARILREAAAHFLKHGVERTSMDRIAASARVSKQAIYEHFSDKEDLFHQVIRADLATQNIGELPDKGDLQETFTAFAQAAFGHLSDPRNFGLFRTNIVVARRLPKLAAEIHKYRRNISGPLAEFLVRAADEHRIAQFTGNATDLATRLGGMAVEGARYFLGYAIAEPPLRQSQAQLVATVFLRGMRDAIADPRLDEQGPFTPRLDDPPGEAKMRMSADRFAAFCQAAANEFLTHGLEGASIDSITAATGTGRATIYRQFGDKLRLFSYVIGREIAAGWRDIEVTEGTDTEERLTRLCRAVLDLHLDPRSLALHHLLVQEANIFPDLARSFYDMQVARAGAPFARIVEEAGFPPPAPPMLRIFHTLATCGVRYIVSLEPVGAEERQILSRQAARIILQGIS